MPIAIEKVDSRPPFVGQKLHRMTLSMAQSLRQHFDPIHRSDPSVPQAVWLSVSPSLFRLDRLLLTHLNQNLVTVAWQYQQGPDEGNSFTKALATLDTYIGSLSQPVHLIGHGMSGVLGLIYTRMRPEHLRSLSLLSVGALPAIDWQAQYYTRLQLLPCRQAFVLAQMARELFGPQQRSVAKVLEGMLQQDLNRALSPHSLWKINSIAPGGVNVPLFVAGGSNDTVVPRQAIQGWRRWFNPGDRLWECPQGRHFFHRFFPHLLEHELLRFWDDLDNRMGLMAKETIVPSLELN